MRGLAPATRVMSRNDPPTADSGSCPSTRPAPAWLTSALAIACGRWLVSATSRSCAPGSIATGRAPSDDDEARAAAGGRRIGRRHRRQELGRSVEQVGRGRWRRRAPRSRRRDGRRRTGGCRPTSATSRPLVEPTSETTSRPARAASTCPRQRRQLGHRAAHERQVGAGQRLGSVGVEARDRSPLEADLAGRRRRGRRRPPRRRGAVAASASEPPIRPSPTTATLMAPVCAASSAARISSATPEGQVERLARIQPRVAERRVVDGRGGPRSPPRSRPGTR